MALYLSAVTCRVLKWSINPISNPYPVYSHTHACDNTLNPSKRYSSLNILYFRGFREKLKSTYYFDCSTCSVPTRTNFCESMSVDMFYIVRNKFHLKSSTFWDTTPCSQLKVTWSYIPEDRTLHNHRCENLKSYKFYFDFD
jgi:hypothetical protein